MEDHKRRKQASIRDASFQEVRFLLGRKLLLGELKRAEDIEEQANAVHFPIHGGPTAVVVIDANFKVLTDDSKEDQSADANMVIPISERRTAIIIYFPNEKSEHKCLEETRRQASELFTRMKKVSSVT
ncbi:hypothetical protein AB4Z22_44885, partial [Paenibacillus sp. TAF58]